MKARRSCNDLGVCQARPGCGCARAARHPFAPGTVERYHRPGGCRAVIYRLTAPVLLGLAGLVGYALGSSFGWIWS